MPAGTKWPCQSDGRSLSFLAAISLDQLPSWTPLPPAGWLLFFAALRRDRGEELPLLTPAVGEDGSPVRVLFSESVALTLAPDDAHVLTERPIRGCSAPTIPDDYDALDRLGLDEDAEEAYEELAAGLRFGPGGWSLARGAHWTLGAWSNLARDEPARGSVLLLHLDHDDELGLDLGAGTLHFRIAVEDLERGGWHRAWVEPGLG